jgi:hypothetical protein
MSEESNSTTNHHNTTTGPSYLWVGLKFLLAAGFISAGVQQWTQRGVGSSSISDEITNHDSLWTMITHRRLSEQTASLLTGDLPSYVQPLMEELNERKKLFAEAEVIKYWFEYTGPLQVSCMWTCRLVSRLQLHL